MEIKTLNEQIERLRELIRKCYATVAGKNGTVPEVGERNMENLPTAISSIKHLDQADLDAAYDAFKGSTGMIPKEEQTIGNLKYAIRMNQEEMEPNEINFVDFNGMVLSMTIEEVMQLTEMPKPNEYYNLTFEHWTKSLEEIQDGRCHTVGATYHTTDGFNYYVVETTQDGEEIEIGLRNNPQLHPENLVYWGDGTYDIAAYSQKHVYEKKGTYTICFKDIAQYTTYVGWNSLTNKWLKEVYLNERVDRSIGVSLRYFNKLEKICFPDNGTALNIGEYRFSDLPNLKSIVIGSNYESNTAINYMIGNLNLRYFVADGHTGAYMPNSMPNLRCLSLRNITSINNASGADFTMLQNLVFDNVTSIGSTFNKTVNESPKILGFKVVDLPETVTSIANTSFQKNSTVFLIRSLTPPTLRGTSVFWGGGNGYYKPVIHIRKDATYTDAAGTTYTGLEAYAHATNWATLYANTNYTFIDDL